MFALLSLVCVTVHVFVLSAPCLRDQRWHTTGSTLPQNSSMQQKVRFVSYFHPLYDPFSSFNSLAVFLYILPAIYILLFQGFVLHVVVSMSILRNLVIDLQSFCSMNGKHPLGTKVFPSADLENICSWKLKCVEICPLNSLMNRESGCLQNLLKDLFSLSCSFY